MLRIAVEHINSLCLSLEAGRRDGSWQIDPVHLPFADAALIGLREIVTALDNYMISENSNQLNRDLLTAAMDFTQRWETWIASLGPNSLQSKETKVFHEYLLRFTKGIVKAYRIWRIDSVKREI